MMKTAFFKLFALAASVVAITALLTTNAGAAGFALYEWGPTGTSLGGNLTGVAHPESVAFNPAGITDLDNNEAEAGVMIIAPKGSVSTKNMYNGKSAEADLDKLFNPAPALYLAGPLKDWEDGSRLSYGLGIFSRFGLTSEYERDWDGRYNSTKSSILTASFQPTVSYRFGKSFSVAVGADLMYMELTLEQTIDATKLFYANGQQGLLPILGLPTTINDPSTKALDVGQSIKGTAMGIGGIFALQYKPVDYFAASLTYRSQVKQKVSGTATFSPSSTVKALMPTLFYTTGANGEVTLPDSITFGVMYKPAQRWTVGVGAVWTRWSTYDDLTIEYDSATYGLRNVTSTKDWKDVWRLSLSAEWQACDWMALRASYIYDQTPIDDGHADYLLPTSNRNIFGIGAGFKLAEAWAIDVSYSYLMIEDRDYANHQIATGVLEGSTSNSDAHIVGLDLRYSF